MFKNSENIRIDLIEVDDAEPMAGALFKKAFNANIPDFPKHFLLLATDGSELTVTLGYGHVTKLHNIYLGGGMCVNSRALKHLPKPVRQDLSQQGGVAFTLVSKIVNSLDDCDAVFAYVGHRAAYKIDLAVGFIQTQYDHLIVYWKKHLDESTQEELIELAHQQGPF